MKRMAKSGAEVDATSKDARRALACLGRPGVTAGIKRQMNKRDRRAGRAEARGWSA